MAASRTLDGIYNGIVFKKHEILDAPSFKVDDDGFADICEDLSHVNSAYDFNAIPIHILGSIYERFLGKVIVTTDKRARVEEKPEVRKAGGVYYTPDYIVRYIVENTVGKLIEGKTPAQIAEMRFADIACGSGSFLLGVYDLLLRYHLQWFNADNDKAKKAGCLKREDGAWHLSLKQRREILLNNIYGVDIDHQAVEVAQLSLYLKLLEDESTATAHDYQLEFHETLLPSLNKNIVCGNSLVGRDISTGDFFEAVDERTLNPMDFEDRFPDILKRGGFDAVVGNPPYRMLQPHNTDAQTLGYLREHYVAADFKVEIFHLFLQRAASLVKKAGFQSYIVPTTVLNNVYAESLRKWLLQKCSIDQICIARGRIFADADVHTSVLIFQLEPDAGKRNKRLVKTTAALSQQFVASPHFESHTKQETFSKLPGSVWNILVNEQNKTLISRLTTNFTPLKQVATINRGLVTGDRKKYFATEQVTKRHVPIITGSDVLRYLTKSPGEFVLFKRPEAAGGCWDPDVHFAPHKLVVRQICETPTASIVSSPIAVTANIFTIRAKNLENELYLLGIINSRLMKFFWKTMFTDFKDSFPQVTIFSLEQLPICVLDTSESNEMARFSRIVALVEQMLSAEKQLSGAQSDKNKNFYSNKCESVDRQIDELVYELYALTEKEITIVKDSTADSRHS
jgi:type I restriction-modification system DNA methylase subunit